MTGAARLARIELLRLGHVTADPATRQVHGPSGSDSLEPRVMQVLCALAEEPGRVVTRDELILRCWDGRVVSDDALNRAIQRLRRLAQDVGGGSFSIRTIHKVGYRLDLLDAAVADAEVPPAMPVEACQPSPASTPPAAAPSRGRDSLLDRSFTTARDPLNANYATKLVYALWTVGRDAEADRAAYRALQLWPKHIGAWLARLWLFAFTGRAARALAQLDDTGTRPDLPPWMLGTLRQTLLALIDRRPANIDAAAERLIAVVARRPSQSVGNVMMLCALGRVEQAMQVAEAYLLERGPLMASVLWKPGQPSVHDERRRKTNMLFVPVARPLRNHPRFEALMRDSGLDRYWQQSGTSPDYRQRGLEIGLTTQVR